jgi:PKD repeat protein
MGLGFYLDNPLTISSVSPILTRTFQSQACGDSIGHVGSINRVFRMEGNTSNPLFKNANIKFLNPSELAGNNQDSMHIFVSEDRAQIWRQRLNNAGDADSVTSDGSTYFTFAPNYTVITAANYAPCVMEPILINQIITGITPNDTLFSIDTAVSCSTPVDVRLYATGEPGAFIEWRDPISNLYTAQGTDGYYDALSLGTYWVRVTNIRGCMDSLSVVVVDVPPGSAAIGTHPGQICIGNSVSFSPVSALSTSTYNWNFGDGTTASTSTASHLYTTIGTYTITLVVTTAQGCLSSSTSTIQINALPLPSFSSGPVCAGLAMNFNNSTTVISLPTTVDLNWDFGDGVTDSTTDNISGTSSATGDISHIYSVAGTYNVTLTASANGCSSDTTISVTVYPLPVADFTFSSACQGAAVVFTNSSSIADASSLSYLWDFNSGSGPTSSTVDPSYSYGPTATGTYTVSLTATSSNGCVSDTLQAITIAPNPVANFTTTNACQGTSLTNNLASFVNGTTPLAGNTYAWTFGDGNTGTGALSETNAYASPGTYTVSLVVTTAGGCVGSVSNNVIIYPIPSVSFSSQPAACSGENVIFTNTTSPTSSTYVWLFPSTPTSSTSINVSQAFSNPGTSAITVPITLTATSLNGCSASSTNSITINPLPTLSLGDSITTCGTTYPLDANPGGVNAGSTYLWNTLATTDSILVALDGTYSVTVTSPSGCINSESVSVILNGTVLPTLGADATFCDNTLLDAGYPGPGSTYLWSTGATSQTITITAPGPGTYSVTVTDVNGCIGTNSVNITIVPSTPVSRSEEHSVRIV